MTLIRQQRSARGLYGGLVVARGESNTFLMYVGVQSQVRLALTKKVKN